MKHIPFLDLRAAYVELESEINQAVLKSMRSGWYTMNLITLEIMKIIFMRRV